jgi:hypothetical protein
LHLIFGVLPALVLSIAVHVFSYRMRRRGDGGAGVS